MSLKNNFYIIDAAQKIKYYRLNRKYDEIVNECAKIDSIDEFAEFKKYVVEYIKTVKVNGLLMKRNYGCEGFFYGHRNAFFEYAGISTSKQAFIFPAFEAGADLREVVTDDFLLKRYHSYLLQSSYKNSEIRKRRPYSPIYNIGPYILYANSIYNSEKLRSIKSKWGKTVLLFPGHTFEGVGVDFDKKKFVKEVFSQFSNKFDTILVSVYWNDVDDPLYEEFSSMGAKLVSAGFRGDQQFIHRLKTIFELSDVVASNLAGSYIGFSKALKKPFYLFGERARYTNDEYSLSKDSEAKYEHTLNEIFYSFSSLSPSENQLIYQNRLYEHFWGGSHFKTKEEARDIIDLSQKLLCASKGSIEGFEKAVIRLKDDRDSLDITENQYDLFLRSLE